MVENYEKKDVIVLEDISKTYGSVRILKKVNLTIREGEKVVILGPSGSGKSTLVRCMNRLEIPEEGKVFIRGVDISDPEAFKSVQQDIGMVFQQFNLFPHMSVIDNCMLALRLVKKMPKKDARRLAMHYLRKVHMHGHARKWPSQLSGGQQQRLAIARALCLNPSMMLFDEPTSSLDPEMVKEVFDTMMVLANEGKTMVCVTHSMGFARQFADRVIFVDRGEIVEEAPPAVFFESPQNPRTRVFLEKIFGYEFGHP